MFQCLGKFPGECYESFWRFLWLGLPNILNYFEREPCTKKEPRFMNFDEKRVICDGDGCPLFVIKEPLMQVDDKQYVYATDSDGKPAQELFRIGSNFGKHFAVHRELKECQRRGNSTQRQDDAREHEGWNLAWRRQDGTAHC